MEELKVSKKIVLLGDGAVGKTSLIRKFVQDMFDDSYIVTIGTKISKKTLTITHPTNHYTLTLMIWDILGQKDYTNVQALGMTGASGALIICDGTRSGTLESLQKYWIPSLQKSAPDAPLVFLSNKCDLTDRQQISMEYLTGIADQFNAPAFMTSAKTGENVEEAFAQIGKMTLEVELAPDTSKIKLEIPDGELNPTQTFDLIQAHFVSQMGDQEDAMAMIRKHATDSELDPRHPDVQGMYKFVMGLSLAEGMFLNDFKIRSNLGFRRRLLERTK